MFGRGSLGIGEFESCSTEGVDALLEAVVGSMYDDILFAGWSSWLSSRLRFLPHCFRGSDSGGGNDKGEAIAELNNGGIDCGCGRVELLGEVLASGGDVCSETGGDGRTGTLLNIEVDARVAASAALS